MWGSPLDSVQWLGVSGKKIFLTRAPEAAGYTEAHGIWEGPLPSTITPSNSSISWAGGRWAMVILPLPDDTLATDRLLIHEAIHVLQPSVLPTPEYSETGPGAAALDGPVGRTWLRLELKALTTALRATGAARDTAAHDALLFRAERYTALSPDEITRERALDVKEGVPEYIGWILSNSSRSEFLSGVDSAPAKLQSFIRGFPYYTGPAYGMLLDDYTSGAWRTSLRARPDLQSMLLGAISSASSSRMLPGTPLIRSTLVTVHHATRTASLDAAAHERANSYGGPAIVAEENVRWTTRQKQLAEYRAKFVDGPTIRLRPHPLTMSFDPRGQAALGAAGSVMANVVWKSADGASLHAPAGALVNQSFTELRIPLGGAHVSLGTITSPTSIEGTGWTLVLVPGWRVRADGTSVIVDPPLDKKTRTR
jgi:hypothetical protein